MMSLLLPIINDPPRSSQPFFLLQSSIGQSSIPVLRQILAQDIKARSSNYFLLFSLGYPPSPNLLKNALPVPDNIEIFDWVDSVPGYDDNWSDPRAGILSAIKNAPSRSLQVVIDSIDALCSDIGSFSETYKFLSEVLDLIRSRPIPSRLILHGTRPSKLLPLLTLPTFSPSLVQLTAHPPVLLAHLAKIYLTPPPPASLTAKFWRAFLPLSERSRDVDRLVYGATGEGSDAYEMVLEILIRGGEGSGRKRGIERELEGWSILEGACDLTKLESLNGIWTKKAIAEAVPDPTQNVSFNLSLTSYQQQSRAQVPLPYAHEGRSLARQTSTTAAAIFYDPDSADDIDADDPDEDLDI